MLLLILFCKMRSHAKKFLLFTGTVAGVYVGMEYGVERVRGTTDWVCLL
jgi:hypothetical protein